MTSAAASVLGSSQQQLHYDACSRSAVCDSAAAVTDPQVHSGGLRHIRTDRRINEWRAPGRRTITRTTSNTRQLVIALSGGGRAPWQSDCIGGGGCMHALFLSKTGSRGV
jgi:hypothetical protein